MIAAMDDGWEIVGEARDGYEALELLGSVTPDVLLTDIRMPRMDGIQLQQLALERLPNLFCVVISGYDEFTYVQQSLRMGVKDYLLKPIEREQLAKVLNKLKAEIEENNRSHSVQLQSFPGEQNQIHQHVREHLIEGFLRGNVQENDLKLLQRIGLDFDLPYYLCMVIKLDKYSVDRERYYQTDPSLFQLYIQQFVQEILEKRAKVYCFVLSDTEVVALINLPDTSMSVESLMEAADVIRIQIKSFSKITVTIGVGGAVAGVQSIPRTFNEAQIALLYRLIVGGNTVLPYQHITADRQLRNNFKKWSWEAMEQSINEGNTGETVRRVESVITELCQQTGNPEVIHQQICKLLLYYYEQSAELGIAEQWLGDKDIRTVLFDICAISSREELIEECSRLLGSLTSCIADGQLQVESDPIEKSIRYLEKQFARPITLKDVADHVFLSPAYFSTIFKQRTGTTLIERLTEIRMEEAKKRLTYSDEKIAFIAETTGFANLRHFNRVFKSETGKSPKDFRSQVRSRGHI